MSTDLNEYQDKKYFWKESDIVFDDENDVELAYQFEEEKHPRGYHGRWADKPDIIKPEDFHALADAQRGKPEEAMLKVQFAMGGGVLNPIVENVGDLTHRMAERNTFDTAGYEYVKSKVQSSLASLRHSYGFEREMRENIVNNAKYQNVNIDEYRNKIYDALDAYAKAHAELPTFNEAQKVAQQAAISVGERNFALAQRFLHKLMDHLGTREEWVRYAHEGLSQPFKFADNTATLEVNKKLKGILEETKPKIERIKEREEAAKKINETFSKGVEESIKAGRITAEQGKVFATRFKHVVRAFPKTWIEAVGNTVKEVQLWPDIHTLTTEMVKLTKIPLDDPRDRIAGTYNTDTHILYVDGDWKQGAYAHELQHAFDVSGGRDKYTAISRSDEWMKVFTSEISPEYRGWGPVGDVPKEHVPLTYYAMTHPSEGFAEYGRLVFQDRATAKEKFPQTYKYWKKIGAVEE